MKNRDIEAGEKFGEWTVLRLLPRELWKKKLRSYECQCSCGFKRIIDNYCLLTKRTERCARCNRKWINERYRKYIDRFEASKNFDVLHMFNK